MYGAILSALRGLGTIASKAWAPIKSLATAATVGSVAKDTIGTITSTTIEESRILNGPQKGSYTIREIKRSGNDVGKSTQTSVGKTTNYLIAALIVQQSIEAFFWIQNMLGVLPQNKIDAARAISRELGYNLKTLTDLNVQKSIEKRKLTSSEKEIARELIRKIREGYAAYLTFLNENSSSLMSADVFDALKSEGDTRLVQLKLVELELGLVEPPAGVRAITQTIIKYVRDGDTVITAEGEEIRLLGVDTPESITEAGHNSSLFLESFVLDRPVVIRSDPANYLDTFDRRLGVIYIPRTSAELAVVTSTVPVVDNPETFDYNVNMILLGNAYAKPLFFEDNSEVNKKIMRAKYEDGFAQNIAAPLADLQALYTDTRSILREWRGSKADELKSWKSEQTAKFKSSLNEEIEDAKDEYFLKKAEWTAAYSDTKADVKAQYSAKNITYAEYQTARTALKKEYYAFLAELKAKHREILRALKDPYVPQKAVVTAQYNTGIKELSLEYYAELKDQRAAYNEQRTLIKTRANLPDLPEIAPSITLITPVITPPPKLADPIPGLIIEVPTPPTVAYPTPDVEGPVTISPPVEALPPTVTIPTPTWEDVKTKTTKEILDGYPEFKDQLAARELPQHKELVLEYLELHPQEIWNQYYDAYPETLWIKPYATHDAIYDKVTGTTSVSAEGASTEGHQRYKLSNSRVTVYFLSKTSPSASAAGTYYSYQYYANNNRAWVATGRLETVS